MARIPTIYDFDGMPAGSFTWWFGLASKVPTGWLILDGSTFSATEYPELYAVLGTNVLPRLTDGRFIKGSMTSKVTENVGLSSLSADASNLSLLNITAIPIIKTGSRNIYYTDAEIGNFVNSLESRVAALERNTSNLGATPMDVHNTTLSAHNGFNTKANVSTVETLTGRVQGLQERLETLENEETGE